MAFSFASFLADLLFLARKNMQENANTTRELLDKVTVARMLSLSLRTVDNLIERGELRVRRIGRRVLVSRVEVERFARGSEAELPEARA